MSLQAEGMMIGYLYKIREIQGYNLRVHFNKIRNVRGIITKVKF